METHGYKMFKCIITALFLAQGGIYQEFLLYPTNIFKTKYFLKELDKDKNVKNIQVLTKDNAVLFMNTIVLSGKFKCYGKNN